MSKIIGPMNWYDAVITAGKAGGRLPNIEEVKEIVKGDSFWQTYTSTELPEDRIGLSWYNDPETKLFYIRKIFWTREQCFDSHQNFYIHDKPPVRCYWSDSVEEMTKRYGNKRYWESCLYDRNLYINGDYSSAWNSLPGSPKKDKLFYGVIID